MKHKADREVIGGTGGTGHAHYFDPQSGWCHYCHLRDDGRLVGPGGTIWHEGRSNTTTEASTA